METCELSVSKTRARGWRLVRGAALAASLGMLALAGCSSENADKPPEQPIEVNMALDKCQMLEPNLYKCPAIDQPMCTPQFNRTAINCVRIGPKGSIFVQRQQGTQ